MRPYFSIFTPSHNTRYIRDALRSLRQQTFQDFEWVVALNGPAVAPTELKEYDKARLLQVPGDIKGVGALKRFACERAKGRLLLELDHDDMLAPHALAIIKQYYEQTGAQFLYSDFAQFYGNGSSCTFTQTLGWEQYAVEYNGRTYQAMRAFDPEPTSIATIHFAPNHVRVWDADLYTEVGGHAPELHVADDLDLILRSYIGRGEFCHIPHCLYFYRMQDFDGNTYIQHNADIQRLQQQISNKYFYQLIAEWSRRNDYLQLDLGGRINKPEGYTSVDLFDADVLCDVTDGLPFADNSVAVVRAQDFLEHIHRCAPRCNHKHCFIGVMNEIYRVLMPGGWFLSSSPSVGGYGYAQDPTHVNPLCLNTFWYFTNRKYSQYVPGIKCRFAAPRLWESYPSSWHENNRILYVSADLVALKGQRYPGRQDI